MSELKTEVKTQELKAKELPAALAKENPAQELARLKAELASLKKNQEEFEEKALEQACKAVGVSPADFISMQEAKNSTEEIIEFDIGDTVVHINGMPYSGVGRVTRAVAEVIMHMASASRDQKMKSMVGRNYELIGGLGGPMKTRLISTVQG
mgnify:CR=1 FL=1